MNSRHRRLALIALAFAGTSLAIAGPAPAGIGHHYTTLSRPTSGANYSYTTHDGCQAKNAAKPSAAQTIFTDEVASGSMSYSKVAVRVYYYAGTGSAYTNWDIDNDAADVNKSTYLSSQHDMQVGGAG